MVDLKVGETYKIADDAAMMSAGAIIEIIRNNGEKVHFVIIEESEHSKRRGRGNGAVGSLMLPVEPNEITPYRIEPEEIPEIELKPVNFNDLFGG